MISPDPETSLIESSSQLAAIAAFVVNHAAAINPAGTSKTRRKRDIFTVVSLALSFDIPRGLECDYWSLI
jgi:hypothetical protein